MENSSRSAQTTRIAVATVTDVSDLVVAPIRSPRRSGGFRGVLALALLTALIVGAIRSWPMVTEAFTRIASLHPGALALLAGVWALLVVVRGLVYRSTHPELRLSHGVALDQVNLAANNALPGGSLIGIAARFRMGRSLGLSPEASGLTVAASGQAFALGRWVVVVVIALRFVVVGRSSDADHLVLVAAAAAFAIAFLMWRVVTGDGRVSQVVLSALTTLHRRVALRSVRMRRVRLEDTIARLRRGVGRIVRERGSTLLVAGMFSTVASALVMVVVVGVLTDGTGPGVWDLLRAYLFARVATSFIPTPGNAGVLDGALVAGIVATGVDPSVAIAAVVLYRAVTFVVPMVFGGAIWLVWRRRSAMAVVLPATPTVDGAPDPVTVPAAA